LSKADQDLAAARQAQAQAEASLAATQSRERDAELAQVRYAQEMSWGAQAALAQVATPPPEVVLAQQLVARAESGLDAAIGKLPAPDQAEMKALIGNALSSVQAQRDAALAALGAKDKELAATSSAKEALEKQVPVLQAQVATATATVQVKSAAVDEKQAEVVSWADKKAQSDAEAGSFKAYAIDLVRLLLVLGIIYGVVHFVLPSLAQEFTGSKFLSTLYRWAVSVFSSHQVTTTQITKAS
jgi:chromosome segregation ATPase